MPFVSGKRIQPHTGQIARYRIEFGFDADGLRWTGVIDKWFLAAKRNPRHSECKPVQKFGSGECDYKAITDT